METNEAINYAQSDFNLPHDVLELPSGGVFYKSKKKSVKIGYLTASDENILLNNDSKKSIKEGIVLPLLRNKLYEREIRPEELLEGDVESILIFLRNTSFGPEYKMVIEDPKTGKSFEATILLDRMNIIQPKDKPNEDGTFTLSLPFSKNTVKVRFLSLHDTIEIDRIIDTYPTGRVAPTVTTRLNKMVVELNGKTDRNDISVFCESMPIGDSKYIRKFLRENEPRLDLMKEVIAPSGEKVTVSLAFGVEFFRPFF
jgi:hypothetical protein